MYSRFTSYVHIHDGVDISEPAETSPISGINFFMVDLRDEGPFRITTTIQQVENRAVKYQHYIAQVQFNVCFPVITVTFERLGREMPIDF